jgi:hypothetical protein
MPRTLIVIGALLLILGAVATSQGADAALRFYPLIVLPLGRPFVAGPDIPPYLTTEGITVVYVIPGAALVMAGALIWYRRRFASDHRPPPKDR